MAEETDKTETETETTENPAETPKARPPKAPPSLLQRESDRAIRPGFRNPPNSRSKAQKKKK